MYSCILSDYVVWGGELDGPVDDFFNGGGGYPPTGRGKFLRGIRQRNVTYRKNVVLQCGCSIPMAE